MQNEDLAKEFFRLIGYLLTSAYGLYQEPAGYGPFRLVDCAGRLLEIMQRAELSDAYLDELRTVIDQERFGTSDDRQLQEILDRLCQDYARELKQRLER